MFSFGSGTLWGTPVSGNEPVDPTPIKFGTLQDVSLDISYEIKELYGHNQFPEAIARAKGKITGKAKFGRINSNLFNQLFFAQNWTRPMESVSLDEVWGAGGGGILTTTLGAGGANYQVGDTGTVTGGTAGQLATYQVLTVTSGAVATFSITHGGGGYTAATDATVATTGIGTGFTVTVATVSAANTATVTNHAAFFQDLGVIYAATGVSLVKIASGTPLTGFYSEAAGVYTFAVADAALNVQISYMYLAASGVGYDQTIVNQLMGFQPIFTLTFHTVFNNQEFNWILWNCISSKMTLGTKLDDFLIPEMDFAAFANAAGNVMDIYGVE